MASVEGAQRCHPIFLDRGVMIQLLARRPVPLYGSMMELRGQRSYPVAFFLPEFLESQMEDLLGGKSIL